MYQILSIAPHHVAKIIVQNGEILFQTALAAEFGIRPVRGYQ